MDEARFWDAVAGGGPTADERAAFAAQWRRHLDLANTRPLRDAATLLLGSATDAEFLDLRRWLITRGQAVFDAALKDPDTLADETVTPSGVDAADLEAGWADGEPTGEWTNLGDRRELRAAFPRLSARYEGGCR
ncbi:hypothetical protein GCM10009682_39420 [Luedemannella flava]|uniref:DUF4240 domain-containing protein n=1 Tax=Luedemannella flava TaxID=349316 RepID=A0ABN2M956_9ACTN